MATLQVKSIDDQLYKALGKRAAMENRSISQEVIAIIKAHLAMPTKAHLQASEQFLALCGSWEDDRSAEDIADELRKERVRQSHRDFEF